MQVGAEVARRARGLGLNVIAHDPFASEAKAAALNVKLVSFEEALSTAEFFSLHMPLTPGTKVSAMHQALCRRQPDTSAAGHAQKRLPESGRHLHVDRHYQGA